MRPRADPSHRAHSDQLASGTGRQRDCRPGPARGDRTMEEGNGLLPPSRICSPTGCAAAGPASSVSPRPSPLRCARRRLPLWPLLSQSWLRCTTAPGFPPSPKLCCRRSAAAALLRLLCRRRCAAAALLAQLRCPRSASRLALRPAPCRCGSGSPASKIQHIVDRSALTSGHLP